jgi:Tripartite tricarboxylate transporter TctB family
MITRRTQENIVALLLLAFFVAVFVTSLGFSPRARLVPVPISVLAMILLLVQLFWQNFRPAEELNVDLLDVLTARSPTPDVTADREMSEEAKAVADAGDAAAWKRVVVSIAFVALFVAMVFAIGPIPAIFVFTFGYFVLSGHYSLLKAAIYTTAFTVVVYLLFIVALKIQPYHGYLEPVVEYLRWF